MELEADVRHEQLCNGDNESSSVFQISSNLGIIEALHRYYQNTATDVRCVWLSTVVDHFHSSFGDKGWGCGYRNFQMLLSSLLQNDVYGDCLKGM